MDYLHQAYRLLEHYGQTRDAKLLIQSADLYRQALAAADSAADRIGVTKRLAALLADHPSQFPDTDETAGLINRVLAVTPSSDPDRFEWSRLLVKAHGAGYLASAEPADLDLTCDAIFQALATCTTPRHGEVLSLLHLIPRLLDNLERHRDWDRLVGLYEQILTLIGPDHPERRVVVQPLASALRNRYRHGHSLADLERCLTLYQEDLETAGSDGEDRAERLSDLADVLMDCFAAFGSRDDIDRAVDLYLQSAGASESWTRRGHFSDAADAVHERYETYLDPDDLEMAIVLLQPRSTDLLVNAPDLIVNAPDHRDHRATIQASEYLAQECDRTGDLAHLRRAIGMLLQAAAQDNLFDNWADYCMILVHASRLLRHRYEVTGDSSFMEQATSMLHEGISECPDHGAPWPQSCLLVGIADLYRHWPDHAAEAAQYVEDAVQVLVTEASDAEDAVNRSALFTRAGELLRDQYDQQADPALLDRAVDCYQQAADAAEQLPVWPRRLSRLASTVTERHELSGKPEDLARARDLRRQAVCSVDMQRPSRLREQTRLATAVTRLIRARKSVPCTFELED
ncbi:hypothetical protein [Acidipropionibacterium virtanenii]|uniref:Uncharacterized protein n=1 Tax=Acidipropionibacterium virtanenii TaxID=2057246 RepID=A0A344UY94_9ACTN|nr:hypothetical protein [Acidipropionibacterium virtanenii]AXE40242.1 hypothetical protein JS278_03108 [Acidipropionibacterium virtanenii]